MPQTGFPCLLLYLVLDITGWWQVTHAVCHFAIPAVHRGHPSQRLEEQVNEVNRYLHCRETSAFG